MAIGLYRGERRSTLQYPDLPCPPDIACRGSGAAVPCLHKQRCFPLSQTLLGVHYRSPPPLRRPQNGDRTVMGECSGSYRIPRSTLPTGYRRRGDGTTLIAYPHTLPEAAHPNNAIEPYRGDSWFRTLTPVNPAHMISHAGSRGVQPPVSIPSAFLFSHTSGYTPHTHPGQPCPPDIACGGSGGATPRQHSQCIPVFPHIRIYTTHSPRSNPAHLISPAGVQGAAAPCLHTFTVRFRTLIPIYPAHMKSPAGVQGAAAPCLHTFSVRFITLTQVEP